MVSSGPYHVLNLSHGVFVTYDEELFVLRLTRTRLEGRKHLPSPVDEGRQVVVV